MTGLINQLFHGELKRRSVWAKGRPIVQNGVIYDSAEWQYDDLGYVIRYGDYGNRNSQYGWEFDHYPIPSALGGGDDIANLRPIYWGANARHGGILSGALST